jgi:hypothetical protein
LALPESRPLSEVALTAYLADLSTASRTFVVAPCRGRVVRAYSAIHNAITVADAVWTMEINDTAITGVSVTVAQSGSAAGDVDTGTPTAVSTTYVNEGDRIEFVSDGASTTTCPTTFVVVIERD